MFDHWNAVGVVVLVVAAVVVIVVVFVVVVVVVLLVILVCLCPPFHVLDFVFLLMLVPVLDVKATTALAVSVSNLLFLWLLALMR